MERSRLPHPRILAMVSLAVVFVVILVADGVYDRLPVLGGGAAGPRLGLHRRHHHVVVVELFGRS